MTTPAPLPSTSKGASSRSNLVLMGSGRSPAWGIRAFYEFNGLLLNDRRGLEKYRITRPNIWDDPEIRGSNEAFPDYPGEILGRMLYGGKTLTLQGEIEAFTWPKLNDMVDCLRSTFDDISGEKLLKIYSGGPNLEMNGNFEDYVDNLNWLLSTTAPAAGTIDRMAIDQLLYGTTSFKVSTTTAGDIGIVRNAGRAPIEELKTYTYSIWVRNSATRTARISVQHYNAATGGSTVGSVTSTTVAVSANTWTRLPITVVAPAGATHARIDAKILASAIGENSWWSGVQIEPGSVATTFSETPDVQILCRKGQSTTISEEITARDFKRTFLVALRIANPRMVSQALHHREWLATGAAAAGAIFTAPNLGWASAQHVTKLRGPITNPLLTVAGTGDQIVFKPGIAIPSGREWTIDLAAGTVVDDLGVNKFNQLDVSTDWAEIPGGGSSISFNATGLTAGTSRVIMENRSTWRA